MNLHTLLDPGETVVYSTQGESFTEPFIALLGLMAGGSILLAMIQPGGVWTIVGIFLLLVALVTFTSRKEQPVCQAQVLVTDSRLMFHASKRNATVIDLPLSEVTGLSWSESHPTGTLRVAGDAGVHILPTMREPDALARALARSAGTAPPPVLGRMLNADLLVPGTYLFAAGALYMLLRWVLSERWIVTLSDITLWQGAAVEIFAIVSSLTAAVVLAVPIGRIAGVLLTVTLMKPCVTAEEMRIGLTVRHPERWHRRWALRWAGLLYGNAWMPSSQAEPTGPTPEHDPSAP